MRILLVEDDRKAARVLARGLQEEGFVVDVVHSAEEADEEAFVTAYGLIVLDRMLPGQDGLGWCRALRERGMTTPVLMLTARDALVDRVEGLNFGADDYLTKPFGTGELLARVRANLRRPRAVGEVQADPVFRFGEGEGAVEVDRMNRQVRRGGDPLHLTPTEYRLLCTLIANAGRVLTHRQLLREVWGPSHAEQSHYLRVYMGHLRQKLELDPAQPRHLLTETGVGYRLVLQPG